MGALPADAMAQAQAPSPAHASQFNIAIVKVERLLAESAAAKAADNKIFAEFKKREQAITDEVMQVRAQREKFESQAADMPERDRIQRARALNDLEKNLKRKQIEFREDLDQRKDEERKIILLRAFEIIAQMEKQHNIDIVLIDALWFSPRIDITDRVIELLDK
jgi:outer membrane protein